MHVRITKLRQQGVRCENSRTAPREEGHLILTGAGRQSQMRKLTLHGPKQGAFDGPPITAIYEPQLVHISASTVVLRGFERGDGGRGQRVGFVQEWKIEFSWDQRGYTGPPLGEAKAWSGYGETGPAE